MPAIPPPINEKTGEPSWRWRRIAVFIMLAYCMFALWDLVDNSDSELNSVIASGLLWLMGTTFLVYCGFATVQDVTAIITTRTGRPYAEPVVGTVETVTTEKKTVTVDDEPLDMPAEPPPDVVKPKRGK